MTRNTGIAYLFVLAAAAFGQGDRGTITGTVTDQSGAVVAGAKVKAEDASTHNILSTQTTEAGNYTLPQLPVGSWNVTVEANGFKTFLSTGVPVQVAVTSRLDAVLQLGATSDTVTVEAAAIAIKTESADITTTVSNEMMVELPIQWSNGWYGNQAVRNPLSVAQLMPGLGGGTSFFGSNGQTSGGSSINGAPTSTFKIMLEGQDNTSLYSPSDYFTRQSSVEGLQEVALQTSNYAAEYGQAQGGIFNFTTKSGTNQYHGGVFYRLTNEDLNAHVPFTGVRLASRQNNYGGSFGGPIHIPHVYDGHNKTFFFFTFEGFKSVIPSPNSGTFTTMPNASDRVGNFASELGAQINCPNASTLCKDALGNAVYAGEVFDPKALAPDGVTRLQFPGNQVPANRFDPVAVKLQGYFPPTTNQLLSLNYQLSGVTPRPEYIPSLKIDHNLSEKLKISAYDTGLVGSYTSTPDGLPPLLSQGRPDSNWANTTRLSADDALRPTMLLHVGAGYFYSFAPDHSFPEAMNFDQVANLGLKGAMSLGFPSLSGLGNSAPSGAQIGGLFSTGQGGGVGARFNDQLTKSELTAVVSLNWVKGSHSYKFGSNWNNSGEAQGRCDNLWGNYGFSAVQTNQPALQGTTSNGNPGLNYASFLLGLPNSSSIAPCTSINWHVHDLAVYAQDTWKFTRKLTFDYGLRYDLQAPPREQWGRISTFSSAVNNPSAGNLPGGVIYQGFGPNTCNCSNLMKEYRYAVGPRLGVAYQLNSKTVLRAAWGLFFGAPSTFPGGAPGQSSGTGADAVSFASLGNGLTALPNGLQGGLVYDPSLFGATYHLPGAVPTLNPVNKLSNLNVPSLLDAGSGRPPRVQQINIAVQREVMKGMTIEAAYVANRGVWLTGSMYPINAVTPAILAAHGLSLSNTDNQKLLNSQVGSTAAKAAGYTLPFPSFPSSTTVTNALRPFPQFNGNLSASSSTGNSWYDSLQVKANARLRHNITALATYTWAKSLTRIGVFNNWTDLSTQKVLDANSIPQALQMNVIYQTPHLTSSNFLGRNMIERQVMSDWQLSAVLRYQSGALITAPQSNDTLGTYVAGVGLVNANGNIPQYMVRDPSKPLYLTDPNGHLDPNQQLVLNPQAWTECGGVATFGCGAPRYTDFRQRRVPTEQIALGRRFVLGSEKANRFFELRMELTNPFNRLVFPNFGVGNPTVQPTRNQDGTLAGGFGFINKNNIDATTPRSLLVVGRISF